MIPNYTDDELKAIKIAAKDFAQKEIRPFADKWEEGKGYPKQLFKKMAKLGFFGTIISKEYGGTELGFMPLVLITEEIARASGTMRSVINLFSTGTAYPIVKYGSEEQKDKFVKPIIDGEMAGCFGISETEAGADVFAMKTTVSSDGDFYVVNGSKTWITNGHKADFIILYAYHEEDVKSKKISAFLFPMSIKGISTLPIDTLGAKALPPASIIFDNVRIPKKSLLKNRGSGASIMFTTLNQTRLICAAGALGLAQACLDESIKYSNTRKQFGKKIGEFQMIQDIIAKMAVEIEASRLLVYKAAKEKDEGDANNTLSVTIAKYHAANTAKICADHAMSIFGANGYAKDSPISRFYCEARVLSILEGSENILKSVIAKDRLGYKRLNKYSDALVKT